MDIAQRYAEYATDLTFEELPGPVVDHAKKLIVDIVANAIGGYAWMDSGPSIVEGVRTLNAGRTGATVFATGEDMAPEWAALANGSMAHSLDYDNHHAKGVIHAGSSVVTCALAAGEETDADGKELITAVVIGYELACRLAMALGPHSSHEMGFHPTGTCATFSGSAIIGRLREAGPRAIVDAMGLNGSQAAGSMQYVVNGAWNKRMHPLVPGAVHHVLHRPGRLAPVEPHGVDDRPRAGLTQTPDDGRAREGGAGSGGVEPHLVR